MSLTSSLQRIVTAKANIKSAIENKGVTYHIIRNGVKEEVSASELNRFDESTENNYELDMEWYLSNGAITLEDFKKAHPC